MTNEHPFFTSAGPRRRRFAASAMAVQAIVINPAEEILLLTSPSRKQGWQADPFHASTKVWMLKRAVDLYRLWSTQPGAPLQPALEENINHIHRKQNNEQ